MKKLALIIFLPYVMLISACSSMDEFMYGDDYSSWNEYDFGNTNVNAILAPGQGGPQNGNHNYQTPRKYYVTTEEEQQYNDLNDRIQRNQQKIGTQHQSYASENLNENVTTHSSTSLPATTVPIPEDSTTQQTSVN